MTAILGQVQASDVAPIYHDLSALELVEARDQPRDARFARSGVSNQGQLLPRPDSKRVVGQDDFIAGM